MRGFQAAGDEGKPDEEEGDTKEEPRSGKDPDRRLETEEQVPNNRSTEKDRAEDIQFDGLLSVRTGE